MFARITDFIALTGRIRVEERHPCLQQIGEHGVVEVAAGVHADPHEEKAAKQRSGGAGDDAERVDVDGVHGSQQTVRIQREDRPQKAVVALFLKGLVDLSIITESGAFVSSNGLQVGPVRGPVVGPRGGDLADNEDQQQHEQDEVIATLMQIFSVHRAGQHAAHHRLAVRTVLRVIRVVDLRILRK